MDEKVKEQIRQKERPRSNTVASKKKKEIELEELQ